MIYFIFLLVVYLVIYIILKNVKLEDFNKIIDFIIYDIW